MDYIWRYSLCFSTFFPTRLYINPLGYNSSPTQRPYDNTAVFGINNSFNINNRQPSSSGLESYNQPQKQQYTNPKVKPFTSWDIALSALDGFGEGIIAVPNRSFEILKNSPNRLSSLTDTMYNLVTNSKKLFNNEQEYKTRDPVSTNQSTLENVINYLKQYQLDREIQLSDINKHQHMSCLSGKDGLSLGLLGLTVGAGKEIADFFKKSFSPQQRKAYGGISGILADGIKDMNNNIKGFKHSYVDGKECYPLLKEPLP